MRKNNQDNKHPFMAEQIELFDTPVIDVSTQDAFCRAVTENNLDDQSLVWAQRRAFMANASSYAIIPVDQLTIIPKWRRYVDDQGLVDVIAASPKHNLFIKLYDDRVVKAARHVSDLLRDAEIEQLYHYYNI